MNMYEKCILHALQHAWGTGRPRAQVDAELIVKRSKRFVEYFFLMVDNRKNAYGIFVSPKGVLREIGLDDALAYIDDIADLNREANQTSPESQIQ